MIIIGVDPGVKGALTVLNTYDFYSTYAVPFVHNSMSDIFLSLSEIRGGEVYRRAQHVMNISKSLRTVERSTPIQVLAPDDTQDNSMEMWLEEPGQIVVNSRTKGKDATGALLAGMSSSRKLGRSIGFWEGIAVALNISITYVPPKKWQSALNCRSKGDKNITKNAAIKAFPFLTNARKESSITHDVADSLLIALYGYMQYAEPRYTPHCVKSLLKPTKGIAKKLVRRKPIR